METSNADLRQEIEALERELSSLKISTEQKSGLEDYKTTEYALKLRNVEEELFEERRKAEEMTQKCSELESSKNDVLNAFECLGQENKRLLNELHMVREESCTSTEKLTTQINKLSVQVNEQQESLNLKTSSNDSLLSRLKEKENLIKHITNSILELLGDETFSTKIETCDVEKTLAEVKLKIDTLKQKIETIMNEKAILEEKLTDAWSKIQLKENQIGCLTKELEQFVSKSEIAKINESAALKEPIIQASYFEMQGNELKKRDEIIENTLETCKEEIYSEYESNLRELHEKHDEEKGIWKAKLMETEHQKEEEMNSRVHDLTFQWNSEKKELERLAKIAADAFKNGTNSVDLLKEQVSRQRIEIEEIKRSHRKEVGELQALLQVKRQRGRNVLGEMMKGGGTLEEAAEFEYLRNILYQYMLGKETQTLSKVLCAVVKFSEDQQRQIVEHEDKRQNLLKKMSKLERKL